MLRLGWSHLLAHPAACCFRSHRPEGTPNSWLTFTQTYKPLSKGIWEQGRRSGSVEGLTSQGPKTTDTSGLDLPHLKKALGHSPSSASSFHLCCPAVFPLSPILLFAIFSPEFLCTLAQSNSALSSAGLTSRVPTNSWENTTPGGADYIMIHIRGLQTRAREPNLAPCLFL